MSFIQKTPDSKKSFIRNHPSSIVGIITIIGFTFLSFHTQQDKSLSEIVLATGGIITGIMIFSIEILTKIMSQNEEQNSKIINLANNFNFVEIIYKNNLSSKYRELREYASEVNATWCGTYETPRGVVGKYFEEELKFLKEVESSKGLNVGNTQSAVIRRLINPLAITYQELCLHRDHMENLQKEKLEYLYECHLSTDIQDIEYFVTREEDGKKRAIFSIVSDLKPGFGILINNDKHKDEVEAFYTRFDTIFKNTDKIRSGNDLWNNMAKKWSDFYLRLKDGDPIKIYCDSELEYLSKYCQRLRDKEGLSFTIIEIGSGAGNFLYELQKKLNNDQDQFIGVECANKMTECAIDLHGNTKNLHFLDCDFLEQNISEVEKAVTRKNSIRIVCCMLNTLGVIRPSKRKELITRMRSLAGENGHVILSVLNSDKFSEMASTIYESLNESLGHEFEIDKSLSYSMSEKAIKTSNGYASQWLSSSQITDYCPDLTKSYSINISRGDTNLTLANIYALSNKNKKINP